MGGNPAEAHPVSLQHILEGKELNRANFIVVDPRMTRTAAHATEYVRVRPGVHIPTIYGMLWHIFHNGWEDKEFIRQRVYGMDEIRKEAEKWPPAEVERVTGLPEAQVKRIAEIFATQKPSTLIWAMGQTQYSFGTANVRASRAHVGGAERVLGLSHRPNQSGGLLRGEDLRDALDLRFRQAGHALDLGRRPLLGLLADLVHAVDALTDEFFVFPAIVENVPEHPVNGRNVYPRANPNIFGGVRRRAREARIDDDHVGAVELLAFENVLQRYRMRLGRIAAHDHDGLGIADVVVAVGHGAVSPRIGDAGDSGRVADARLMIGVVGSPECGELAVEISGFVGEFRRPQPVHGFRSRLGAALH